MSFAQMNCDLHNVPSAEVPVESPGEADTSEVAPTAERSPFTKRNKLHRIRITRRQQGLSLRSAAKRMQLSTEEAREQEKSTNNLTLVDLYRWQQALEVPIAHLLVDLDGPLSGPVLKRARMVRIMKTAGAIAQRAESKKILRLTAMLIDQLIEIMPELKDVSPWHVVGQRRRLDEYGRAAERSVPDSIFYEPG